MRHQRHVAHRTSAPRAAPDAPVVARGEVDDGGVEGEAAEHVAPVAAPRAELVEGLGGDDVGGGGVEQPDVVARGEGLGERGGGEARVVQLARGDELVDVGLAEAARGGGRGGRAGRGVGGAGVGERGRAAVGLEQLGLRRGPALEAAQGGGRERH